MAKGRGTSCGPSLAGGDGQGSEQRDMSPAGVWVEQGNPFQIRGSLAITASPVPSHPSPRTGSDLRSGHQPYSPSSPYQTPTLATSGQACPGRASPGSARCYSWWPQAPC